MDATLTTAQWNAGQKLLFRFFSVYLFIYLFPFPLNLVAEGAWNSVGALFDPMMNWVAHHMLHFKQNIHIDNQNGSGDTSYYFVQVYVFIILSFIATIIWSVADRNRPNYTRLLYWVRVMVRYYLAIMLLEYGFAKFVGSQFPAPDLSRLLQPYGKSSPMGLAWTFLGFSKAFGWFMGIAESAGAVLMLFRRTTLFGACIATTVVTNIVMINFCYDVPVKIFSSNLLLMCLFVLVSEGSRFVNVFILNKPAQPLDLSPVFQTRKMRITHRVIKFIVVIAFVGLPLVSNIQEAIADNDDIKPPLYGIYDVKSFIRNNDIIPPLAVDSTRWNKLIVQWEGAATVQAMNEKSKYFAFKLDTVHRTATMYSYNDTAVKYRLFYKKEDSTLCLYGRFQKDSIYVEMQRFNDRKFLLTNRGFHWINEYPFNR